MDSPTDQEMQDLALTLVDSDFIVQKTRLERAAVRSLREILNDPTLRERLSAPEFRI